MAGRPGDHACARPRVLDLFCGAGGAALGYWRAGFDVVGVDIAAQPHYPFPFIRADALTLPVDPSDFALIHASPPCQAYAAIAVRHRNRGKPPRWPPLVGAVREMLAAMCVPWIMENVRGAPLRHWTELQGEQFGLRVHRPRRFESSVLLFSPGPGLACQREPVGVYGSHADGRRISKTGGRRAASLAQASGAMGIGWMTWEEIREAVPPAYTEYLARQLIASGVVPAPEPRNSLLPPDLPPAPARPDHP